MESGCSSFQLNVMAMKMAAVSAITVLLLCCSVTATDSKERCDQHATADEDFTVPLEHQLDESETLRWMHNGTAIVDRRKNKFIKGSPQSIHANGSLRLTNVNRNSSGKYTPEVFSKDGKAVKSFTDIHLCILEPVPKPEVKFTCSSSPIKLTCNVGQTSSLQFVWLQNNKVLEGQKGQTLTLKQVVESDSFSCQVSNGIRSMTSDPVEKPCYKSPPFLPDNSWIIIGGGGGVVLVLIILVIVCCIRMRRRKRMHLKDEEELRLGLANTNQQHQHHHQHNHPADHHHHRHHHHHHQQQQPAGHTGPRQHRSKQHREQQQQRPKAPDTGHPQPSPRRPAQGPRAVDGEQPPPLPQPRKKAPKAPRV